MTCSIVVVSHLQSTAPEYILNQHSILNLIKSLESMFCLFFDCCLAIRAHVVSKVMCACAFFF